ncbi:MAG TPA: hypothetical protein VN364_06000, partial [Bellilinea sp.]|nr:hypothetical protein [Bellilinea sp.]
MDTIAKKSTKRITAALAKLAFLTLTACNLSSGEPTNAVETPANTPIVIAPNTPQPATPLPVEETAVPTNVPASEPQFGGFMVLSNGEFIAIDLFGQEMGFRAPAGMTEYVRQEQAGVTKKSVALASNTGLLLVEMDQIQPLAFAGSKTVFSAGISRDGSLIAWVSQIMADNSVAFELWVAGIDGSNARKIAERTPAEMLTNPTSIEVAGWTADGKLIYGTRPFGIGGYILFAGWNDLYLYDPADGTVRDLYINDGTSNMCVNSLSNDFSQVAIGCETIQVQNLVSGAIVDLPAVPEQNRAGSAKFSPSGMLVAYGVGRGNPDSEFGQVVVAPADGSGDQNIVAAMEDGYYQVLGWINETSLLLWSSSGMEVSPSVWKV